MDDSLVELIASGFASNTVIPFIGAGASVPHLRQSWDSICKDMDDLTGYDGGDNLASAQTFVDQFGRTELCEFLRARLMITSFEDELGELYLFLLSMNCYFYYTTNQDNVLEMAFRKYGRNYNVISDIQTFRNALPGRPTLVRFHGDTAYPDTIVFTSDDYKTRMISSQAVGTLDPLDIHLLYSAISRTLLFLGYSFRDPNVIELFRHVDVLFDHNPPPSYLIEFEHDDSFARTMFEQFKVTCIDPMAFFPSSSPEEAYRALMSEIAKRAFEDRAAADIKDLFDSGDFGIVPFVTPFETQAFAQYIAGTNDSIEDRISKFRATFDGRNIPDNARDSVRDSLVRILRETHEREHFQDIAGAFINLEHMDPERSVDILTEYFMAIGSCPVSDPFESIQLIHVHMKSVPSPFNILAIARAFETLIDREQAVPQNLLGHVSHGIQSQRELDALDDEIKAYIRSIFVRAYSAIATYANPLSRPSLGLKTPSYEEILSRIGSHFPKRHDGPSR